MKTFDLGYGHKAVIVNSLNAHFTIMSGLTNGYSQFKNFDVYKKGKTFYVEMKDQKDCDKAISYLKNLKASSKKELDNCYYLRSLAEQAGKERASYLYGSDDVDLPVEDWKDSRKDYHKSDCEYDYEYDCESDCESDCDHDDLDLGYIRDYNIDRRGSYRMYF